MKNIYSVTLLSENHKFPAEQLHRFSFGDFKEMVRTNLRRAGLGHCAVIGGPDFSFNEPSRNLWKNGRPPWDPHWQGHGHFIIEERELSREQLRKRLRRFYPKTETILRPVTVKPITDLVGAISYTCKSFFERRVSYVDIDGDKNTRSALPLKPDQQRELASVLSAHSFTDRLFLRGFRRRGQRLVRT